MNKFFRITSLMLAFCSFILVTSCDEEDPPLPDNKVAFVSSAQGMTANDTFIETTFTFVRAADANGSIVLTYTPTGVTYGTDFTTTPAPDASNKITIDVPAGATTATLKVTKTNTTGLEGDEKVAFTIESVSEGLVVGDQPTFTLSFSEIIATSATMQIQGGGSAASNIVFIDLSGNSQVAVERTIWDLAFSSKADEFRVLLNSPNKMLVRALDKTDMTTVTATDTLEFGSQQSLEAIFGIIGSLDVADYPAWISSTLSWMDDPKGDKTKSAIAEVAATDAENKVYIVNRGTAPDNSNLGWMKIRVLRSGSDYTLQYAEIGDSEFESVTVAKNTATRFQFVSLSSGDLVNVEPEAKKWDFAWTGFTNVTPTGQEPTDPFVPYYFQDIILTNLGNAGTFTYVTGTTGDKTYDTFTADDATDIVFVTNNQLSIGSSWRSGGGPPGTPGPAVKSTNFYLVKDADGNIYKVQFTKLTSDAGERGKPEFKFELLTKGS